MCVNFRHVNNVKRGVSQGFTVAQKGSRHRLIQNAHVSVVDVSLIAEPHGPIGTHGGLASSAVRVDVVVCRSCCRKRNRVSPDRIKISQ
eukprot:6387173-Pyramimonas_sp.AAC.1